MEEVAKRLVQKLQFHWPHTNISIFKMVFFQFAKAQCSIYLVVAISLLLCIISTLANPNNQQPVNDVLRRTIRSPQLFNNAPGRKPLVDLKPPAALDLADLRQKMANLANLTALLEKAIAAEKNARASLETFAANIKDQEKGITSAVNPDSENYWMQIQTCGGILVSQTGRIIYKPESGYKNHERCTWTVRANHRSKIKITLNGNVEAQDYVAVTQEDTQNAWITKKLKEGSTEIFDGPLVFITFVADATDTSYGFQIDFEGLGANRNLRRVYQHFHLTDWTGQFDSSNLSERLEKDNVTLDQVSDLFSTVVINPSYWGPSKLSVSIPSSSLELRPSECDKTSLAYLNDFASKSRGKSTLCCGSTCDVHEFETFTRVALALFSSSDLSDGSAFQINWSTDTRKANDVISEDTCGGMLKGNIGRISYKEDSAYGNNERCVWVLQPEVLGSGNTEIKIQVTKDQFEFKFDYVTVSYFENEDGKSHIRTKIINSARSSGDNPLVISATFAFVKFYSDSGTFGSATGFELTWEFKYPVEKNPLQVTFEYETAESGSKSYECAEADSSRYITIINPQSTSGAATALDSVASNIRIFTSAKGLFNESSSETDKHVSKDGTVILVTECEVAGSTGSITWEKETTHTTGSGSQEEQTLVQSDKCGEILHGDSGKITYKLNETYDMNERCTWVIRAKTYSSISLQLMTDGFESCCDKVEVYEVRINDGAFVSDHVTLTRDSSFHTFTGPLVLVMFYSDTSVNGTGFELAFQTKGDEVSDADKNLEVIHSYHWINEKPPPEKPFQLPFLQPTERSIFFRTIHINVGVEKASLTLDVENLEISERNKDYVTLFSLEPSNNIVKRYTTEIICPPEGTSTESAIARAAEGHDMKFSGPLALILVGKFEIGNANKKVSASLS